MPVTLSVLRAFRPALAPAAILLAAVLALAAGPALPPSLSGLKTLGPYVVLLLGTGMGVWFNRGRAFIALASLLAAFAGYSLALEFGADSFAARAVFTATAIFVPLNFLLALVFPERGVSHHFNYRWLMLAVVETLFVAWIASAGHSSLSGTVWQDLLEHWLLRSPPTPMLGRLLFAAAFVAAAIRAPGPRPRRRDTRPLDIGQVGALVAFFIACEWVDTPGAFGAFMTAAGAILLVSLLQESHRLAFRDELTGLPSRRALEERLHGLGPVHAIAMLDVDHFKKFNDTHGHDIGDQVLQAGGRAPGAGRRAAAPPTATAARSSASCSPRPGWPMRCRTSKSSAPTSPPTRWRCAATTGRKTRRPAPSCAACARPRRRCR